MNQREKIQYKTGRCNIPGGSEISTTSTTEIHKREEWHKQYKIFEKTEGTDIPTKIPMNRDRKKFSIPSREYLQDYGTLFKKYSHEYSIWSK